ncbi:MAG: carboxypeptidase-like regulatory domain-containing protein [Myxococcota bacterium]
MSHLPRWTVFTLLAFGCSDVTSKATDTDPVVDDTDPVVTEPGACVSDTFWTFGNQESPLMHPGGNCIQCHEDLGEGPRFSIAGTVFSNPDEPDDCNGLGGIEVEITDSEGSVWTTTTNAAGNFYFRANTVDPVFPITALVRDGTAERAMLTPQSEGSCASCHTWQGENGAAGRIVAP